MKTISTPNAPAAVGPYAQGNIVNGLLFASGQIALVPETGELAGDTIEAQSRQDINDFAAFNAIYAESFCETLPARSCVAVDKLPKGALVEVEVIAEVVE